MNRRSSSASGSAVRPVCTGPGCTIVLRGAVRRRKRRPRSSSPAGPARRASGVSPHTVSSARRTQRDAVGVGARVQGAQAGLVEVHPGAQVVQGPAVEQHTGVDRLAALDPRHDADHGVLERVPRHGAASRSRAGRRAGRRADPRRPVRDASRSGGNHASRASRRASRRVT